MDISFWCDTWIFYCTRNNFPVFSDVLRQMAATRPTPPYRCFSLSHLFALSPQSEHQGYASQPETRKGYEKLFSRPGKDEWGRTSGDGRVGTSTYLDLNLPQLKLGLHCRPNFNCGKAPPFWQKGGALDPLQCFLSIVYPRKEGTWKASQSSSSPTA